MASNLINTRADLDALRGTDEHAAFMFVLANTLWRLDKDDVAKCWRAVLDTSTVERFGFTQGDFTHVPLPALPVYVAPLSKPAQQLSSLSYLGLFTEAEQLAVVTATMQSAPVKLWYDKMLMAEFITLDDPRTAQGLAVLVQLGLLTETRKEAIMGAML